MPNVIEKILNTDTAKNADDPIPTGATNLTIGSTLVTALALILGLFTDWSNELIGEHASPGVRAALALGFIAALTVVYAADLLARGYASAHAPHRATAKATGEERARPVAAAAAVEVAVPKLGGKEEKGWIVLRVEGERILVVKADRPPQWLPLAEVRGA